MKQLEFHYDFSCPYAYLASTQVRALAERAGAELLYKPFLLGGVFKALENPGMSAMSPARARLNGLDMQRWAEHWDVPFCMPPGHPNRTVLALRAALASADLPRASHALFEAYWAEGRDVSDPDVVAGALGRAGFDGRALVQRANDEAIKQELFARTDEAVQRGVFGAPTFFVAGERLWGQDRLDFVARALGLPDPEADARPPSVESFQFWFDFSSPFAYLASTQVESLGARVLWRPFLLGGLFRAIGTADVPIATFSPPKASFQREDMDRFARHYGVPFRFPSQFPIRSVLPLRMVLASDCDPHLIHVLFRASWAEDRDIADRTVLAAICREHGMNEELVERAESDPALKQRLRDATDEAARIGLCGAPSFVVDGLLFWGQDRLGFVKEALRGWRPRAG